MAPSYHFPVLSETEVAYYTTNQIYHIVRLYANEQVRFLLSDGIVTHEIGTAWVAFFTVVMAELDKRHPPHITEALQTMQL